MTKYVQQCKKQSESWQFVQQGIRGGCGTVGVHQGSVLSPLRFIIVLEALSRNSRVGAPWELFFADDFVITSTSLEECVTHVKVWKEGMESKCFRVNMIKTMFMDSGRDLDILQDSCVLCAVLV